MLPQIHHLYEPQTGIQPLTVFIGLNPAETELLVELSSLAKVLAPLLSNALANRIQQFTSIKLIRQMDAGWLRLYLQDWFLQLFQTRDEGILNAPHFSPGPSLDLILTGIDVILSYGNEITQRSSDPAAATLAFHKALALKISSEQLRSQVDETEHLYEMMLLD